MEKKESDYLELIKNLKIKNLRITSLNAWIAEDFSPPAEIRTKDKAELITGEGNGFKVLHLYQIRGKKEGEKEVKFKIDVTFEITYESNLQITPEEFEIFRKANLYLHTWPYLRELVQEVTLKMGLPPLILSPYLIKP
ncbi:hypothetical protein J7K56_00780 [Candidatus Calescamantes bacterium]|nr:hypothetical protein [Candidatus Calescamantes bacterium]